MVETFYNGLESRILFSNIRPTIGGLADSPDPVNKGAPLVLIASGVADSDGAIAKVEFYRDSNGNGIFEKTIDQQIGLDGSPRRGWNFYYDTTSCPPGKNTFFARSRDNLGEVSKPAVTQTSIVGKIDFRGAYQGTIEYDTGEVDIIEGLVTSQTRQAYFAGTIHQVGLDVTFDFVGTILKNNQLSLVYSDSEFSGTGTGSFKSDGSVINGNFKTKMFDGRTASGTFSMHRI